MKQMPRRYWKALMLLSIVVPVGLLVSFRLTGILPEPEGPITIAETTTLGIAKWEFEKPSFSVNLGDIIRNSCQNNSVSAESEVFIYDYDQPNILGLGVNITAFVNRGHIRTVHLGLRENSGDARIDFLQESRLMETQNLTTTGFKNRAQEVFINLTGIDRPNKVLYRASINWILFGQQNQTYQLDVISEVTYFNGTVYKKIVQPFRLGLIGQDDNNSLETADEIEIGKFRAFIDKNQDPVDFYRIWLEQGQTIQVESNDGALDMYVYNPNHSVAARSLYGWDEPRRMIFNANARGSWYLKVERHYGASIYRLNLTSIEKATTLEAIEWQFERPSVDVEISKTFESLYKNGNLSIKYGIDLLKLFNKTYSYSLYGYDSAPSPSDIYVASLSVHLEVVIWSEERGAEAGHVESVHLVIHERNPPDRVGYFFVASEYSMEMQNLIQDGFDMMPHTFSVNLTGANQPYRVYLRVPGAWLLAGSNSSMPEIEISFDLVYVDCGAYKRAVLPFRLKILDHDDNDSFETADEIDLASFKPYRDRLVGGLKGYVNRFDDDPVDYYKVWLGSHLVLASLLNVWGNFHNGLNIYIYDPNRELVAQSLYGVDEPREISFFGGTTGWWYIKIEHIVRWEIYTLSLSVLQFLGGG